MKATAIMLMILAIGQTAAFNIGALHQASDTSVNDERRREFLSVFLATVAATPMRVNAESAPYQEKQKINGILDSKLRGYHNSLLPNWQGTSLPGPLSLSEAYAQVIGIDSQPVLSMGRWPDPILRQASSTIASSVFQNKNKLEQLQMVAKALRNTARNEGAVGLAAQQCGVDASLLFIDGVKSPLSKSARNDGMTGGMFGDTMNGVFGQSSWRKSQKEITGEGAYVEGSPILNKWPRKSNQQSKKDNGVFLVNPRIINRSPESEMLVWTEECLVLPPEFRATLLRDAEITIEYESLECLDGDDVGSCGLTKQITLQGELARCAQHEMDHDRGALITDHVALDELLSIDGIAFMAEIENSDGLHQRRMELAYAREISKSSLLSPNEKFVSLAMEDHLGYHSRVKCVDERRPWFVQSAHAIDQEGMYSTAPLALPDTPPQSSTGTNTSECDASCMEERKRRVEQRRAMMQQSRSSTRRADVLELSQQRATLYGAEFKGLPPKYCSKSGFCP